MTYRIRSTTLTSKIKVLNETIWEGRVTEPVICEWLDNFHRSGADTPKERLHALFMLSNVMYFGSKQMRRACSGHCTAICTVIPLSKPSAGNTTIPQTRR